MNRAADLQYDDPRINSIVKRTIESSKILDSAPSIQTDEKGNKMVMDAGGQSYTFAIKDLSKRESPYHIGLAYRVVQAGVTTEGAVCPTNIGDSQPVGGQPLLLWADGTASGYRLKMIKLDSVNKAVMFTVEIDGQ